MRLVEGWWIHDQAWAVHPAHSQRADLKVIDVALQYIQGRHTVVQAGARVGLWPRTLAQHFAEVYTFEPDEENCECALANLRGCDNVTLFREALGGERGTVFLEHSDVSDGLHFITPHSTPTTRKVRMSLIDDLELERCDAILLDIEGYELDALHGAVTTIERYHPVLVLEENKLCQRYGRKRGDLARYLEPMGYRLAEEFGTLPAVQQRVGFPGADLIFVHR